MIWRGYAVAAFIPALVAMQPSSVHAEPVSRVTTTAGPAEEVVVLFEKSKLAFRAGQFEEAARLLLAAYAIRPEPVFLYNLARAYEGLGRREDALVAYRRYLAEAREVPDRGAIEQTIFTLQRQIEDRKAEERRRAELEARRARLAETAAARRPKPSVGPWITGGVGAATVATGVVLGLLASSKHSSAVDDGDGASAQSKQGEAESFATAANVCFISGGAVIAAGAVWLVIDLLGGREPSTSETAWRRRFPLIAGGTF